MKRIYIAGALFNQGERAFNENVVQVLEELYGYETFLPQRDGHLLSDLLETEESREKALEKIFELDVEEIRKSDALLFIMDGRVPDEGACVELGIAYALGKECYGLKTDSRSLMDGLDNPLITGALKNRIARNFTDLHNMIRDKIDLLD